MVIEKPQEPELKELRPGRYAYRSVVIGETNDGKHIEQCPSGATYTRDHNGTVRRVFVVTAEDENGATRKGVIPRRKISRKERRRLRAAQRG